MTLETREEEEILHKIRRLDRKVEAVELLCMEILLELRPAPPAYQPTNGVVVIPTGATPSG
jgi:hypothetical protein